MSRKKRDDDDKTPKAAPDKLARPFKQALSGLRLEPAAKPAAPPKKTFAAMFEQKRVAPDEAQAQSPTPRPANALGTKPHAHASEGAKTARSVGDLEALHDAFAGVRPLGGEKSMRVPRLPDGERLTRGKMPEYVDADAEVRKRLGALVAGDLRFYVGKHEDDFVHGVRSDAEADAWVALTKESVHADDALDLHGYRAADAEVAVAKFVRARHRRGARVLKIVHGKGLHSETGTSVLREAVVHSLTETGAAPLVYAFATAHPRHGGSGAMFVRLKPAF